MKKFELTFQIPLIPNLGHYQKTLISCNLCLNERSPKDAVQLTKKYIPLAFNFVVYLDGVEQDHL